MLRFLALASRVSVSVGWFLELFSEVFFESVPGDLFSGCFVDVVLVLWVDFGSGYFILSHVSIRVLRYLLGLQLRLDVRQSYGRYLHPLW